MNIYEQLQAVRADLVQQGANIKTVGLLETMISQASGQQDSGLSFSRLQVLRRLMQMPQALNDEDIRLDLLGLEGDLEEAAAKRETTNEPAAYEEDRRPKLKKFYKKK